MSSERSQKSTRKLKAAIAALCMAISMMSSIASVALSQDGGVSSDRISILGDYPLIRSSHQDLEVSTKASERILQDASVLGDRYPTGESEAEKYSSHIATKADIEALKARVGVRDPNKNYNVIVDGFGTGAAPPTEEQWGSLLGNLVIVNGVSDPPRPMSLDISQSPYFPKVGNQGQQGSCTAWSAAYYSNGYLQAKDKDWTDASTGNPDHLMSPAWSYNKVNEGVDQGSWQIEHFYLLQSVGNAVLSTMPYDQNDHTSWGTEAAWRTAPEYRIGLFSMTGTSNTQVIKSWLDEDTPVLITLDATEYSGGLGIGDDTLTSSEYTPGMPNHANTIIGYDDNKAQGGDVGAFKVVNSWGPSWGSEWGGNGYYWMTYEAVKELVSPAWRFKDREDYYPSLLAAWNLNPQGRRDATVTLGVGPYNSPLDWRSPDWNGGSLDFPSFMAFDVTEFQDEWDAGADVFFLDIGAGSPSSTITWFRIERYTDGYVPGNPDMVSDESPDTPQVTPGYVTVNFKVVLTITSPEDDSLLKGTVDVTGSASDMWDTRIFEEGFESPFPGPWTVGDSNASNDEDYWGNTSYRSYSGSQSAWSAEVGDKRVTETIFEEDFEGSPPSSWVMGDSDSSDGEDYWGLSSYRALSGSKSMWAAQAGNDSRLVYSEDFDDGGSTPSGWTNYSEGPDVHPWEMKLDSGSDYRAECNSDEAGAGTNITEWIYMDTGFNASSSASLTLEFYLDYEYYDGDEYARVLYATEGSFPTFYELETWTSSMTGTQSLDLSAGAGDPEVHIAFIYHGTDDWYMRVDDVEVFGTIPNTLTREYDDNMAAYMYRPIDFTSYDSGTLTYNYWLDAEDSWDYLYALYFTDTWSFVGNHTGNSSGWQTFNVTLPSSVTYFGFDFISDSGVHDYEGAYVDDITVTGTDLKPNRDTHDYDDGMSAYMYRSVNLTDLDSPMLSYRYWLDAEDSSDHLYVIYYDNGSWSFIDPHTGDSAGWQNSTLSIPQNASDVGFFFESDSSVHDYEGAYVDDVILFDVEWLTDVYVKVDNGSWELASGGEDWKYSWDTTAYSDGPHTLYVRAYFGSRYAERSISVIVDNTPPSNPTSYSSSHVPNLWSNDNVIDISWFNAFDETSGVYGYSIDWTNSASLPDTTVETTGSNGLSQPLNDGNDWFFHVRTVDAAGNWAPDAYHVGPFYIDTTPPSNPDSYLSSHMIFVWDDDNTISISWTGATDATSGIYGYSFVWSQSPSLVPDMTIDTIGTDTTSPPLAGADDWYFHVRAIDNADNWAIDALHVGPFCVDTQPPSSTHLLTGLEGYDNWYISNVSVQINAQDGLSGVNQIKYRIVGGSWENYTVDFELSSDGVHTVEYYSVDNVGNLESTKAVGVKVDRTAPGNPDSHMSDHTVGVWSNESDVFVEWYGAFDDTSGLFGYSLVWDRLPTTLPDAVVNTTTGNTTGLDLADGNDRYLHIRTRDVAGNWATDAYHVGPFWIDASEPLPGAHVWADLEGLDWMDVNISWDISPSDPVDVVRYDIFYSTQYNFSGAGYVLLASVPSGTDHYVHANAGWGDTSNYFYIVKAVDMAEKIATYPEQAGKFVRSLQKGWQLLSAPLVQRDASVDSVLRTVDFDAVRYYDAFDTSDHWKAYYVFKGYNDLSQITHSMGVWINVVADSDFVVAGAVPQSTDVHLKKGWNLVSFPSFRDDYSVADLKASIDVITVEGFDPFNEPYFLRSMQDSEMLEVGCAYWVLVSADSTWVVSN